MKRPKKKASSSKKTVAKLKDKKCLIPPRVPDEALNQFAFRRNDDEARRIAEYVEWQSKKDGEIVTFLEKVQTEHVYGQAHDCWNVHTDKTQWWVITGPTNLYSQALFPSLDYTLSFHIGLMARVNVQHTGTKNSRLADRLAAAFRRWEQAADALDRSTESEEIQAVGMRCRECLIAFTRVVGTKAMIPGGEESPQTANFLRWSELIADTVAAGSKNKQIRGYLKAIAKESWQLVNWLTHVSSATRHDGTFALDATQSVLESFGTALIRYERHTPDRCLRCGSLNLIPSYQPEKEFDGAVCESCGWEKLANECSEAEIQDEPLGQAPERH